MNFKVFEYQHKDIPTLNKEVIFRITLTGLFFITFVWQFISMILAISQSAMSVGKIVSSIFVLFICLIFSVLSILYALKTIRTISVIKKTGKCVSSVNILFNMEKNSFLNLYKFVTEVLAVLASLVLVCGLTYSILEITYYSSLSYYMPLLLTFALCGYYSVFHIRNEINTIKTLESYNRIY